MWEINLAHGIDRPLVDSILLFGKRLQQMWRFSNFFVVDKILTSFLLRW